MPAAMHTLDASEFPALLAGHVDAIEYLQLDRGMFQGSFSEVRLGDVRLMRESHNRALLKQGALHAGRCTVGFVRLATAPTARIGAQLVRPAGLVFVPAGTEFEVQSPPGEAVQFSLDAAEVARAAEADGCTAILNAHCVSVTGTHALVEVALELLAAAPRRTLTLAQMTYARQLVLGHVLEAFSTPVDIHVSSNAAAYRLTSRARAYIEGVTDHPLTVLDLCAALGASRRTLQSAYRQVYGLSPLAYLRLVRLNRAHRDLLHPLAPGESVTEVALRWGFWHMGQFARDFRSLFGVTPSATLQRGIATCRF